MTRSLRAGFAKPVVVGTIAGLVAIGGLALAVGTLIDGGGMTAAGTKAATLLAPGTKIEGRLAPSSDEAPPNDEATPKATAATPPGPDSDEPLGALPPTMEQPYLVVLSTRQTPEELLQDFRSFKEHYPSLLGTAKARVDKVQGQDGQIWHRLSLIPPLAHADAKDLCSGLKAAGLTGCWIKPLPVSVAPPPAQ
jgi:hypothetical protein